jgi:hypothetical protein
MNNNIEESRVTFDVAKLLKEKEFDIETIESYCSSVNDSMIVKLFPRVQQYKPNVKEEWYAPTQQLAIDWIRINFGIYIILDWDGDEYFCATRKVVDSKMVIDVFGLRFNKPEEAKEAAINHVLTNLI